MNMSILNGLKALPLIYFYHPKKAGWRSVFNLLMFGIAVYYAQSYFQ